jgi:hypothetical protein
MIGSPARSSPIRVTSAHLSPTPPTSYSVAGQQERSAALDEQETASQLIDAKIASIGDWRGETLARMRALIREADPEVVETVKWRKPSNPSGVPVWEHDGILCTGETYKGYVKLTFAKGAKLRGRLEDRTGDDRADHL